eukprot:g1214.t1
MEANAELILMAALYTGYSGDRKLFSISPERLLCAQASNGTAWEYVGTGSWDSSVCLASTHTLLSKHPQLYSEGVLPPHTTIPRGKSKPGLYPGQGKVVITRVTLHTPAAAVSVALTGAKGSTSSAFTICVRSLSADRVVATASIAPGELPPSGWLTIQANATLPAGTYDVAVRTTSEAKGHAPVGWLSDSSPASSGGARVEVYDETDAPKDCCGKHAFNGSLAAKLEQALVWELEQSKRAATKSKNVTGTRTNAAAPSYGMFVTPDARFSGVPARAKGITSSSAMWDQVRMGWKAAYPALRVLGSLHAWRSLEAARLVSPPLSPAGGRINVSDELLQAVQDDLTLQLGKPDGSLLTWRSCTQQNGPPSPPSGLPSSSCDRDDPHTNQPAYDLGFVPDHALAVKLGVVSPEVLLNMLGQIRHNSGHRLATKSFEDNNAPLIMVDSEKWSSVDADGYAHAQANQSGWSQVFRPPRTDGPGNYGNHEQNGGRLFSVSKFVFEAMVYPEAVSDWAEQVRGSTAIASALLQPNQTARLPFPALVRKPMPPGSLAQGYCKVAYGASCCTLDSFNKTPCDFFGDMTWGLRDGQLGPTLQLLKTLLGLDLGTDGSMQLYGEAVDVASCTATAPCSVKLSLPLDIASTWPTDLAKIELGGINVGLQRNVSIECTIAYEQEASADAPLVALAYTVRT